MKNRAGIIKRSYHTCVYKIKKEQNWYITAEGATPLLTYFEAMIAEPKLRQLRTEIFRSFCRALQSYLDGDVQCRDKCVLIEYNDIDENGKPIDIGELLYDRVVKKNM